MTFFLRRNPEFTKLWTAQMVSQGGDWLNKVATLAIIDRYGGASAAWIGVGLWFGIEQALRMLPTTLLSPFAGPVADRVPRKLLLVGGDLFRALLVLGYLAIDSAADLKLVPILIATQVGFGIFFDAARQASLPNTVRPADLHTAIALSSATWSVMLSLGALAGGLLVGAFGTDVAFAVDASTYLTSALLYTWIRLPPAPRQDEAFCWRDLFSFRDMRRGLAHARGRGIAAGLLTKAFWGGAGGLLVLVALSASTRYGAPGPQAVLEGRESTFARNFGVLFAARGIGTAIGPFLARRFLGSQPIELLRTIRAGFLVAPLCYLGFGFTHSLPLAAVFVGLAHIGGGAIWVASTSLWQQTVDDRFRGRVHALDFFSMTLSFSMFALLSGALYDAGLPIAYLTALFSGLIALMGALWWRLGSSMRKRLLSQTPPG